MVIQDLVVELNGMLAVVEVEVYPLLDLVVDLVDLMLVVVLVQLELTMVFVEYLPPVAVEAAVVLRPMVLILQVEMVVLVLSLFAIRLLQQLQQKQQVVL